MAATAAAMGAAAAAIRKKEEDVEKQRMRSKNAAASGEFEKPLTAKEQQEERLQMKDFEEEFMKMLTKTSLRRFAQADGVPAADTQEKILEKCTRRAAKKKNQQQEGENTATNDDDDEDSDVDEDDEKIDIGVLGLLSPSQILSQLAKEVQDRRGDGEEEEEAELAEDDEYVYSAEDFDDEYGEKMRARRQKEREENPGAHPEPPTRKPFELDFDSKFLTPQERQQLRREHDLRWANAVPSRLRQWLDSESRTKNDNVFLSLDIFCELVVRIPIEGVGKEEVLAFCSPFGQCEYQGPCFSLSELKKAAEARKKNKNNKKKDEDEKDKQEEEPPQEEEETEKAKQARLRNETRKFCHIIRFNKGVDAIRCFIELNGFYIDPNQYVTELNSAAARLLLASKKKQFFNNLRETGFLTSALGDDLTIKSGETFNEGDEDEQDLKRCWTSRYIFVTCDFFRISFFDKAGLSAGTSDFIPRSEMTTRSPYEDSSSNKNKNDNGAGGISGFFSSLFGAGNGGGITHKNLQPPPSSVSSKIPSNWNPADIVCKKLATRAKELIGVFPLAASHKDIEWVGICRAANTISMFIPLVSSTGTSSNEKSSSSPRVWVLTLRALRACQVNIVALFRAIDASETVDELMDLGWKFAASQEIGENNSKNLGAGNYSSLSRQKDEEDRIKNSNNKKKNEQQGFWSQFAFGNFFVGAGDPGQRKTNRMIERGAIFLFALVVVWVSFVAYGMMSTESSESKLNHVKGKKPFSSSEQNSQLSGKNSKKKADKNKKKNNNAHAHHQHPNFDGEDFKKMFQERVRGGDL